MPGHLIGWPKPGVFGLYWRVSRGPRRRGGTGATSERNGNAPMTCPNCGRSFNCEGPPECWCLKVAHDFDWEGFITRADLTHAKNLTQKQVDGIRYNPEHPPKLPPGLVLPEPPPEPEAKSAAPLPPEA